MAKKKLKRKIISRFTTLLIAIALIYTGYEFYNYYTLKNIPREPVAIYNEEYFYARDFGFLDKTSDFDYNKNSIDDYTDILLGSKKYAKFNPVYKSGYYDGGYPPVETEGVCTDLIWYALENAGYNLKDMMVYDIKNTFNDNVYKNIKVIDTNIDFRRVSNQDIFFGRYAEILTNDIYKIMDFVPGDILTFDDSDHIAIVSDKRNKEGIPYLLQNRDETQKEKEEDRLLSTNMKVTGHYRFTLNDKIRELLAEL